MDGGDGGDGGDGAIWFILYDDVDDNHSKNADQSINVLPSSSHRHRHR